MPCYFRILTKRNQGSNLCGLHRLKPVRLPRGLERKHVMQLENDGKNVFSSVCVVLLE